MIKIATYNINNINKRLPVLLRWLLESRPDIVCLQELKAEQGRFPEAAIAKAGYQALWHGQKTWNGVAILSRTEPIQELRRKLPGGRNDVQSRYLEAIVGKIVIACLYAPNGNPYPGPKFSYKLQWYKRLQAHAKTLLAHEVPVVLAGDFNIMPTELDCYKPGKYIDDALFRIEMRQVFARLQQQGWTDALRHRYPRQVIYTFWDYLRQAWERNAGLRLDHFLLSPQLRPRLRKAGVDTHVRGWEQASDHAPTWIELKA
ncbi:exodeoxyribonuclease III [Paraflavitalea pollutisoli]|uniref:exodeoxyribonuclease III n=1 Tax=Paraflavitalea pollutisoli TaxID=3034143 RepID=UPI0023ECFDCC|nr:exodeoxyribonuclease III [Paraflavitalea sp. H1-2-19X]